MPPQQNAKFFCARPDGSLTPLIAVDEFPHGISVGELPRVLAPGDTQGMTSCGLAEARSEPWAIDGVAHVYARHLEHDRVTEMHQLLVSIMADTGVPARVRTSVEKFLGQTVESNPTNGTELSLRMTSMPPMQIARNMPAHGQSGNVVSLKYWTVFSTPIADFPALFHRTVASAALKNTALTGFATASVITRNKVSLTEEMLWRIG